jgi:hypothetical protein
VRWLRLGPREAPPLAARYKLLYDGADLLSVRVVTEVSGAAEGSIVEHSWEGAVTEGAGVCLFKGVHNARYFAADDDRRAHAAGATVVAAGGGESSLGHVHACLRTPFACFQRTKSGEVPQSVHSAMGLRRAGLTDRVFTIIAPAAGGGGTLTTERIGRVGADECAASTFFEGLARGPRLVLASILLARDGVDVSQRSVPGNPKTRGLGSSTDEVVEVSCCHC